MARGINKVTLVDGLNCHGIYKILNAINGKVYIGSAISIRKRLSEHRRTLKNNRHHSSEETKAKIGKANSKKTASLETRLKMSAARAGIIISDLTRAKLSASTKLSWAKRKESQQTRIF